MVRQSTSQLQNQQCGQPLRPIERRGHEKGRHADNTPEKQRERPVGTDPAISNLSGASSRVRSWGGSRNSASRTSDSISLEQAANFIAAAHFAQTIGIPFNRHITIHWEHAGVADAKAAEATGQFLKCVGDWVAKKRGGNASRIAWAWVRENDVFGRLHAPARKGSHVHILLHLPAGIEIGRMQRRWLRAITGQLYRADTIRTTRIGGTVGAWLTTPAVYEPNLGRVVGYVLKGTCPVAAAKLGLTERAPGGRIIGRRVSTSENIGRTARKRAGAAAAVPPR